MGLERLCARFARMPDRTWRYVGSCVHCAAGASPRRYRDNHPGRGHTLPGGAHASPLSWQPAAGFYPHRFVHRVHPVQGALQCAKLSGYVWQRYANDLPKDLVPKAPDDVGFVMPEAQYARYFKVYQAQQGNEELIGWPIGGGNGHDAQFDLCRAELLEVELAVLGFAPLGDIQLRHDLRCAK